MMKRAVVLLLLVAALCGLCSCAEKDQPVLHEEDIRAICELATVECYYNNVAKVDDEGNLFQKDRKMWIEYEGSATLGIDMSKVIVEISGDTVRISLPDVEILSSDYTLTENSYICSADGWLIKNKISTEEQENAVRDAQEKMLQDVRDSRSLYVQAENRAKALIANYIIKMGEIMEREYTIEWEE